MSASTSTHSVAFTGLGVVSALGIGREAFWKGLCDGRSGIGPLTLFDAAGGRARLAGEVRDFKPEEILGAKGLRLLDRTTRLALCAAHEALRDAGLDFASRPLDDCGVALGTGMGSVSSLGEFTSTMFRGGPRAVNPALFPNTVANSAASQVSIRFGITGLNTTVSTGFTSALGALDTAALLIACGHARAVLAGGVEELSEWTHTAFDELGFLSPGADGAGEACIPLDRHRNGAIFGEGAAMFVLESLEDAQARGATIHAMYAGGATTTDPQADAAYASPSRGLVRAVERALARSRTRADEVGWVAMGANSSPEGDAVEVEALRAALGRNGSRLAGAAFKSLLGETVSASGALQVAGAVLGLKHRMLPATIVAEPDPRCEVETAATARDLDAGAVLVSCPSPLFHQAACVLKRSS